MKTARRRTPSLTAVSALLAAAAVAACSSGSGSGASASGGTAGSGDTAAFNPNGVLSYALDMSQGGISFDPAKSTVSDTGNMLSQLLNDSLFRAQPDGVLSPELASTATIVNPTTITVALRSGVRFQDGTPLDAEAAKETILINAESKSVAFPAPIHDVSAVDVTGALSFTIHLAKPDAGAFYPLLADMSTTPLSPAALARRDPDPVTNPLGAGPFRVKSYTPDQSLVLVKNPGYWSSKGIKLGGIDFIDETSGSPAAINALKAGTVDATTSDISQLGALNGGGIETSVTSSPTAKLYFPLCDSKGPLADVRVRQALSYGLDRNAIDQALAAGKGEPAWALVPPSSSLYPADLSNYYAYDPAKAKQLLSEAGYGKGLTLTMMPEPTSDSQQLALIAQQEWKQIGVNLRLSTSAGASYVQDVFVNHLYDLTDADVVRSGLDAISFIFTPGHLGDMCGYDNETVDSYVSRLSALAPNDPRYVQLFEQAQDYIVKNALDVWAIWLPTVVAYNSNRVGGIQTVFPGVTAYPDFFTAYVKK